MKKSLDILSKALKNLSPEEIQELLDSISDEEVPSKQMRKTTKKEVHNEFFDMDIKENPKHVAASKKLNTNKKKIELPFRSEVKLVKVRCRNCGKEFELPTTYPNIEAFVCCVK